MFGGFRRTRPTTDLLLWIKVRTGAFNQIPMKPFTHSLIERVNSITPSDMKETFRRSSLTLVCSRIECGDPRSKPALQLAMFNLEKQFAVVGVMEQFETSIAMMEAMLPRFCWTCKKEKLFAQTFLILENWHSYCC